MSRTAQFLCRSAPWRLVAGRVVLPWALQGFDLRGHALEIGCGSGAMAAEVLRRYPDVHLTATDFDESMVAAAKRRVAPFGDRGDVRQADATSLPFDDAAIDTTLSFLMLHHVVEWEQAVAELVRVLRPGGLVVGYDLLGDGVGRVLSGHEHGTRLMRIDELRRALAGLPVADAVVRPAFGGLVARFAARKAGQVSGLDD